MTSEILQFKYPSCGHTLEEEEYTNACKEISKTEEQKVNVSLKEQKDKMDAKIWRYSPWIERLYRYFKNSLVISDGGIDTPQPETKMSYRKDKKKYSKFLFFNRIYCQDFNIYKDYVI